jgi:hypothetical protein
MRAGAQFDIWLWRAEVPVESGLGWMASSRRKGVARKLALVLVKEDYRDSACAA